VEKTPESGYVMKTAAATFSPEDMSIKYVCGVDIGSQSCAGCILRLDKNIVVKPISFANAGEGWKLWEEKLSQLDAEPSQILIGMEATSRYGENLYQELEQRGYVLRLLHAGQTHQFHQQQRLRAKTDRLDAMTIARMLLSGEARAGYVPSEQVTTDAFCVDFWRFLLRSRTIPAKQRVCGLSSSFQDGFAGQ
jgi:transposase